MRYLMLAVVLAGMALPCLMLSGCNTVKGLGKDVHDSAQNVQTWMEGSDENREQLSSNTARAH